MTHEQAQDLLDQRRAGADMPEAVVNRALELTGDKEPEYTPSVAMRELAEEAE